MTPQPQLDFKELVIHSRENNSVSQKTRDINKLRLSSQVVKFMKLLCMYKVLTVHDATKGYWLNGELVISDCLPRRILDIEEWTGIHAKRTDKDCMLVNGLWVETKPDTEIPENAIVKSKTFYWFDEEQIIKAKKILRKLN